MRRVNVLLVAAVSTGIVGLVYAWVGLRLRKREVRDPSARRALAAFALWWLVMGANQLLWMLVNGAAALSAPSFEVQATYAIVQRALLVISLAGLLTYLLYVLTGRDRRAWVCAFYAAFLVASLYSFNWASPIALKPGLWRVDLAYARQVPAWSQLLMLLLLVGPPVVAALAYGWQWRRAPNPAARARLLWTSVGLTVWWVFAVAAGAPRTLDLSWFQAVNRVVGLVVAVGILLAYERSG